MTTNRDPRNIDLTHHAANQFIVDDQQELGHTVSFSQQDDLPVRLGLSEHDVSLMQAHTVHEHFDKPASPERTIESGNRPVS